MGGKTIYAVGLIKAFRVVIKLCMFEGKYDFENMEEMLTQTPPTMHFIFYNHNRWKIYCTLRCLIFCNSIS